LDHLNEFENIGAGQPIEDEEAFPPSFYETGLAKSLEVM
jgi:hypothetical protein